MTSGTLRGLITGALIVLFVALIAWAYSSKRRAAFDAAARMPLDDDGSENTKETP